MNSEEMASHSPEGRDILTAERDEGDKEEEMGVDETIVYLHMQLVTDELDDSREVKRKKLMARTALALWTQSRDALRIRYNQSRSRAVSVKNEIYQLISIYSVFAGVILAAVTQSSRMKCEHLWSPVALSVLPYVMLLFSTYSKFMAIRQLERRATDEYKLYHVACVRIGRLNRKGYSEFDFERDCDDGGRRSTARASFVWLQLLTFLVSLSVFELVLVFSIVHVLCWT